MTERRISFWDFLFWIALIILLLWVILKGLGYINTPAFVEIIPYISGIFIAGAIYQQFRNMQNDISYIKYVNKRFLKIEHEHNLFLEGKMRFKH